MHDGNGNGNGNIYGGDMDDIASIEREWKANSLEQVKAMALRMLDDMEALEDLVGTNATLSWYEREYTKRDE